jgi:NitT/TauT family transport system substrate-binding protein
VSLIRPLAALVTLGVLLAGCGNQPVAQSGSPETLRLGYFPNLTHASAIVGVDKGFFAGALGSGVDLQTQTFNAGPDVVTALFSGALDASFVGPNPAINAYIKSDGAGVRIIAGATSGGAFFVVSDGINSAADLAGKTVATPQLGNTQDVAMRSWLASQGLRTDTSGGGDVSIQPAPNAQILDTFVAGQISGAWLPEPWATRMVDAGGHVLVDERDLWPDSQYVTTLLVVRTVYLDAHPGAVHGLLTGLLASTDYVNQHPTDAQADVAAAITSITGSSLSTGVIAQAWPNLTFTVDPIAASLQKSAAQAHALGFIDTDDLTGIFDLEPLNDVLAAAGRPEISQP